MEHPIVITCEETIDVHERTDHPVVNEQFVKPVTRSATRTDNVCPQRNSYTPVFDTSRSANHNITLSSDEQPPRQRAASPPSGAVESKCVQRVAGARKRVKSVCARRYRRAASVNGRRKAGVAKKRSGRVATVNRGRRTRAATAVRSRARVAATKSRAKITSASRPRRAESAKSSAALRTARSVAKTRSRSPVRSASRVQNKRATSKAVTGRFPKSSSRMVTRSVTRNRAIKKNASVKNIAAPIKKSNSVVARRGISRPTVALTKSATKPRLSYKVTPARTRSAVRAVSKTTVRKQSTKCAVSDTLLYRTAGAKPRLGRPATPVKRTASRSLSKPRVSRSRSCSKSRGVRSRSCSKSGTIRSRSCSRSCSRSRAGRNNSNNSNGSSRRGIMKRRKSSVTFDLPCSKGVALKRAKTVAREVGVSTSRRSSNSGRSLKSSRASSKSAPKSRSKTRSVISTTRSRQADIRRTRNRYHDSHAIRSRSRSRSQRIKSRESTCRSCAAADRRRKVAGSRSNRRSRSRSVRRSVGSCRSRGVRYHASNSRHSSYARYSRGCVCCDGRSRSRQPIEEEKAKSCERPLESIKGIGKALAARMRDVGIKNYRSLRYKARTTSRFMFTRWLREVTFASSSQIASVCRECEFLTAEKKRATELKNVRRSRSRARTVRDAKSAARKNAYAARTTKRATRNQTRGGGGVGGSKRNLTKAVSTSAAARKAATLKRTKSAVSEHHQMKRHQTRQQTRIQSEQWSTEKLIQTLEQRAVHTTPAKLVNQDVVKEGIFTRSKTTAAASSSETPASLAEHGSMIGEVVPAGPGSTSAGN